MKHRTALALALVSLAACKNEQEVKEIPFDFVAVSTGDFDEMEDALDRNLVASDLYDGFIQGSVYTEGLGPDDIAYKVEQLLTGFDEDGDPLLFRYPAAFVNSGTRGLGRWVYNGTEADDALVSDPEVVARVRDYLAMKRTLVVTDWAYDLVEAAFPDAIAFLDEDQGYDAAQVGVDESIVARVTDPDLAEALGNDQLEVFFDFSYWTVMLEAGEGTDVLLRGDVTYRLGDGEGYATVEDVPLLVAFDTGAGRVVFSSFAWRAQRAWVTDHALAFLVDGFEVAAGDTGGGS